ncbi:unnamed protein product, partial [Phaeothamnion confervicola]
GVVGSTSNILDFITDRAREAQKQVASSGSGRGKPEAAQRLQFVLGTEAGMITSIVRKVQAVLQSDGVAASAAGGSGVEVEIIFPVASEAVMATGEAADAGGGGGLAVVPGVAGGEGCSTAGGCATCPFMKMNDLDGLVDLVAGLDGSGKVPEGLDGYMPLRRTFTLDGQDKTGLGVVPILHMRELMRSGKLGDDLVNDVLSRCG